MGQGSFPDKGTPLLPGYFFEHVPCFFMPSHTP